MEKSATNLNFAQGKNWKHWSFFDSLYT